MAKKAVARQIGTYSSEDDKETIEALASQISGEKPPYLKISGGGEGYVVCSLESDPFPAAFGDLRYIKITKLNLEVALSVAAELIGRGIRTRSFLRREQREQKQFYAVFNE